MPRFKCKSCLTKVTSTNSRPSGPETKILCVIVLCKNNATPPPCLFLSKRIKKSGMYNSLSRMSGLNQVSTRQMTSG